jgi:uncharacterized protein
VTNIFGLQIKNMDHFINWIEIPVNDIHRAKSFYGEILDVSFHEMQIGDLDYAIFPSEDKYNSGALVKGPNYRPSSDGVTIYLDGGADLNTILQKVSSRGGTIIMEKTFFSKEAGWVGLFLDTEGNRIGLQNI